MPPKEIILYGFDTEDDGKGNPFLWGFVNAEGSYYTEKRAEALQYISVSASRAKSVGALAEFWATNLEYDLMNIYDNETIQEVTLRFGRSALCAARWKGAEYRDTMRHIPISVAKLGEMVGLVKKERDLFKGSNPDFKSNRDAFISRCVGDAAISYRSAKMFHETYSGLGQPAKSTLASTALNLWKNVYFDSPISKPDSDVWNAANEAYHGGRTQAFSIGTFLDVTVLDVASMYPWAMTSARLPIPWGLFRRVKHGGEIRNTGIYRVLIHSTLSIPLLPVRTKEGTIYPNGVWSGWYVGEEILEFRNAGGKATVLEGFEFAEEGLPFNTYIADIFALKQKTRGPEREIYKYLLNALYGKFGQKGLKIKCIPITKLVTMKNPPLEWRPWLSMAIFSEESTPPPWSNMIWPAIITARARIKLWRMMTQLHKQGARVLYCDTDSIFYQASVSTHRFPEKAREIGDFERRGHYRQILIVGKKEYALEIEKGKWQPHVKGVPEAERLHYLQEGIATFSRPTRIKEASRLDSPVNVWRKVVKQRRRKLERIACADGSLPTPVINQTA